MLLKLLFDFFIAIGTSREIYAFRVQLRPVPATVLITFYAILLANTTSFLIYWRSSNWILGLDSSRLSCYRPSEGSRSAILLTTKQRHWWRRPQVSTCRPQGEQVGAAVVKIPMVWIGSAWPIPKALWGPSAPYALLGGAQWHDAYACYISW